MSCTLDSGVTAYTNKDWLYAQSFYGNPTTCGFFVTITNAHATDAQMFQVIRTSAELLKTSVAFIVGLFTMAYFANM